MLPVVIRCQMRQTDKIIRTWKESRCSMEQNSQRGHRARGVDATGLDGCSGYEWAEATEAVVPSVGGVIGKGETSHVGWTGPTRGEGAG